MKLLVSPELEKLGQELIEKYHPLLKIIDIAYIFRDEAPNSSRGELVFGQAISVDSRNWLLHRKDVIIQIAEDLWESLDQKYRELLLDHELYHVGVELDQDGTVVMDENSGRPKVYIVHHDIEEFEAIIKRYGTTYDEFRAWAKEEAKRRMSAQKRKTVEALAKP